MEYLGCKGCSNYIREVLGDERHSFCLKNIKNPFKCHLYKRILNPEISEFFYATCERYREV